MAKTNIFPDTGTLAKFPGFGIMAGKFEYNEPPLKDLSPRQRSVLLISNAVIMALINENSRVGMSPDKKYRYITIGRLNGKLTGEIRIYGANFIRISWTDKESGWTKYHRIFRTVEDACLFIALMWRHGLELEAFAVPTR